MVETLVRPDQRTDVARIGGSPRARTWTLAVACVVVGPVVAVLIGPWAPGHDGRQLRFVRRMVSGRR
jgi:hypothetical protein